MADVSASKRPEPVVRAENLVKRFRRQDGATVKAIDHVSFDVEAGEFLVLLGPSGCGKTTLLRTLAGLETPDHGTIAFEGRVQFSSAARTNVPPERRGTSMVFQSYALWPHMTAFRNVAYPLESRRSHRPPRSAIEQRVREILSLVGIPELEQQYAAQMSGGQQQRVALARALVSNDSLVLFDEPLSNVDAKVREQLRIELLSLQRELGFAAVFVTHDQEEAMQLGSRIAVLDSGRLSQIASPLEVYTRPANRYVAKFIGTMNETLGTVTDVKGETAVVDTPLGSLVGRRGSESTGRGDRVAVLWRPESGSMTTGEPVAQNRLRGRLTASLFVGGYTEQVIDVAGDEQRVRSSGPDVHTPGSDVWIEVPEADSLVLPAEDT